MTTQQPTRKIRLKATDVNALMVMANNGGRSTYRNLDYSIAVRLKILGLIEERQYHTREETARMYVEESELWGRIDKASELRNAEEVRGLAELIQNLRQDIVSKGYWLTPAANEFLVNGTVTITK